MFFADIAYAMGSAGGGAGTEANPMASLLLPLLMIVGFYFLLIRPQQKRNKARQEMLAALKKGDKVITGGGLYGRISDMDGEVLTLDLGNGLQVEINRGFITALADRTPKGTQKKQKEDK